MNALTALQHFALVRVHRYADLLPLTVAADVGAALEAFEAAKARDAAEKAIVQRVGVPQRLEDGERE